MSSRLSSIALLSGLVAGIAAVGCLTSAPAANGTRPESSDKITWRSWDDATFQSAKEAGRLIVIDVGIEGCTACRWMDEGTYTDPNVVKLIENHFVAVQVDAEARPDLGERYSNWAWPATIFLTPNGQQVLALRGNKRPRNFLPILRTLIQKQQDGTLDKDVAASLPEPTPQTGGLIEIRNRVAAQLDRSFVPGRGWNSKIMHALPERLEHAFVRSRIRDDGTALKNALSVAQARTALHDDVWGGIFVAGLGADPAKEIIPEKRTRHQAGALESYASAYQLTGDVVWRDRALTIDRYLRTMMLDRDGTFFTTQEDDAPTLPSTMTAREYYQLGDAKRRQFGVPPIDHATYSDRNGAVIRAYLALYRATGERTYLDTAVTTAETLVKTRQQPQGWFAQTPPDVRLSDNRIRVLPTVPRLFLRTQAQVGLAFVDLAESTRDAAWLAHADRIAKSLVVIEDDNGGFFASTSAAGVGRRLKPVEDNGTTARFLWRLGHATQSPLLLAKAEKTIRAVTSPAQLRAEGKAVGQTATALELLASGPVHFVIVTTTSGEDHTFNRDIQALWNASLRVYEPRRVLRVEAPGKYPDRGRPTLYICTDDACSSPIIDVDIVEREANRFASAAPATSTAADNP